MTSCRRGFTLVELLVVIAIIGVLVGLLLPAVQAAREGSRLAQCKNNLRQIGVSTLNYEAALGSYPPGRLRARDDFWDGYHCESTQPSWLVRILPYLEETSAARQWDLLAPLQKQPASLREWEPTVYMCPTRRTAADAVIPSQTVQQNIVFPCGCSGQETVTLVSGAVGDYAGNHGDFTGGSYGLTTDYWRGGNGTGVIVSSRPACTEDGELTGYVDKIRHKDLVDGASNTFLAGEMHVPRGRLAQVPENGPIYNGQDLTASCRIGGPNIPLARGPDDNVGSTMGFGSWHVGVCPFVYADGSVHSVDDFVDTMALRELCHRFDGEGAPIEAPPLSFPGVN